MSAKKDLLQEIEEKIKKNREARARARDRNTIESFVVQFMENVHEIGQFVSSESEWQIAVDAAHTNLLNQIRTLDSHANYEIVWYQPEDNLPSVSAVIVKWSQRYQVANMCDAELMVDATHLLFK